MDQRKKTTVPIPAGIDLLLVTGEADGNLRRLEELFGASIALEDGRLRLQAAPADSERLERLLDEMLRRAGRGEAVDGAELERLVHTVRSDAMAPRSLHDDVVLTCRGKAIRPKTDGQKRFIDAIRSHPVTFGLGPAGTGKTFLACALAVAALERREVGRIVLTRPIVEAGESLGFLPGTMMEKVDPYIRPLYDALFDLMDADRATRLIEDGTIEITPLAFMRGRTFNDSFVILDEAQNTTGEQMKMFLTRLGFGSKMVVTGDESQSDSPKGPTGIIGAREHLGSIDEIAFCTLKGSDVVRNSLVARIVAAYEKPLPGKGEDR